MRRHKRISPRHTEVDCFCNDIPSSPRLSIPEACQTGRGKENSCRTLLHSAKEDHGQSFSILSQREKAIDVTRTSSFRLTTMMSIAPVNVAGLIPESVDTLTISKE
jgi:hypothetical protein